MIRPRVDLNKAGLHDHGGCNFKSNTNLNRESKIKMLSRPLMQRCEADFFFSFNGLCFLPLLFYSLSSSACCPPSPRSRLPSPQLNLIHSEVSNLAGFDVEGVINPTTAELELKDDLGESPCRSTWIRVWSLEREILECFSSSVCYQTSNIEQCHNSFSVSILFILIILL